MRISDWSSDVCSSDLFECRRGRRTRGVDVVRHRPRPELGDRQHRTLTPPANATTTDLAGARPRRAPAQPRTHCANVPYRYGDRKSVVSGKSVSVSLDIGGRRIIKKKKKKESQK